LSAVLGRGLPKSPGTEPNIGPKAEVLILSGGSYLVHCSANTLRRRAGVLRRAVSMEACQWTRGSPVENYGHRVTRPGPRAEDLTLSVVITPSFALSLSLSLSLQLSISLSCTPILSLPLSLVMICHGSIMAKQEINNMLRAIEGFFKVWLVSANRSDRVPADRCRTAPWKK